MDKNPSPSRSPLLHPTDRVFEVLFASVVMLAVTAALATPARAENAWSYSLSANQYFVPEEPDYLSPVFAANRERLHLEARYNYEGQKAGSVWAGYNLEAGDKVVLEATPMLGWVFGDTRGVAPGCEITVTYKAFEFYTEGEYVVDTTGQEGDFLYFWSELTWEPAAWFRFGIVSQRTRAYQTELDVQRGILVRFQHEKFKLTANVFNAGWTDPTVVISAGWEF